MGQLGFLVVSNDPDVAERYDRDDLRPVMHILPGAHSALTDHAVDRRGNTRIAKLDLGEVGSSPFGLRCRAQLASLSGKTARFYTACAVLGVGAGVRLAHVDTTTVVFRSLTADEIERYVAREQPYDCAGCFKAEALGVALFECIESQDPTALIGLPLIWLAGALRGAGYHLP